MAKPATTPKPPSDEAIRHRAHELWDKAGRPHGQDHDHWHQARTELEAESAGLGDQPGDALPASDPSSPAKPGRGAERDVPPKKKAAAAEPGAPKPAETAAPAKPAAAKPAAAKPEKPAAKTKPEKKPAAAPKKKS
jgi:hypothetical protein